MATCLWYSTIKIQDENLERFAISNHLTEATLFSKYVISLYYTMTIVATVGYGDIVSHTAAEKICSILLMFFGAEMFFFTIGTLSTLFISKMNKTTVIERKMTIAKEFIKGIQAPPALRTKIMDILKYNADRHRYAWANRYGALTELPTNIKYEVLMNSIAPFKKIPFIVENRDMYFVTTITRLLKPILIAQMDYIWKKEDSAESSTNHNLRYVKAFISLFSDKWNSSSHFG